MDTKNSILTGICKSCSRIFVFDGKRATCPKCPFIHAKTQACSHGNNCKYNKTHSCKFAHQPNELLMIVCRKDFNCHNSSCTFFHPSKEKMIVIPKKLQYIFDKSTKMVQHKPSSIQILKKSRMEEMRILEIMAREDEKNTPSPLEPPTPNNTPIIGEEESDIEVVCNMYLSPSPPPTPNNTPTFEDFKTKSWADINEEATA